MRLLRHLGNLLGEFWLFAKENKAWWILPIIVMLLLMAWVIAIGGGTAQFIYTLF